LLLTAAKNAKGQKRCGALLAVAGEALIVAKAIEVIWRPPVFRGAAREVPGVAHWGRV
jgi:hypothetical protein